MSLHTQLLRGLLVLPVLLLLAVASLAAPAQPRRIADAATAHARTLVVVADGRMVVIAHAADVAP